MSEEFLPMTKAELDELETRMLAEMDSLESRVQLQMENLEIRLLERLEKTETALLDEFHRWKMHFESRFAAFDALATSLNERIVLLEERVAILEGGTSGWEAERELVSHPAPSDPALTLPSTAPSAAQALLPAPSCSPHSRREPLQRA